MKNVTICLLAVMSLGLCLAHGANLPRGTFEFSELEQAKAKAIESKKWIAYLYTDKNSTCPLCQNAVSEFVDEVKSKAVIVYLPSDQSKTYWKSLSDEVQKVLMAGKYIPKMAVVDASSGAIVASVDYDAFEQDEKKAMRAFKKVLTTAKNQ